MINPGETNRNYYPETHAGGFEVQILNPEDLVQWIKPGRETYPIIQETPINDNLFNKFTSTVSFYGPNYIIKEGNFYYQFASQLYRLGSQYNLNQVEQIETWLKNKYPTIHIKTDENDIGLEFITEAGFSITSQFPISGPNGKRFLFYSTPISNEKLPFLEALNAYVMAYKKLIQSFYRVEARSLPRVSVEFHPPEVNINPPPPEIIAIPQKLENPKLTDAFSIIGGQDHAVEIARDLAYQIANRRFYKDRGVSLPKGILLIGPTGNGKTLLAKCIATATEATFEYLDPTDKKSMWYSQSSFNFKAFFTKAKEKATFDHPVIIFVDEVDTLARTRDGVLHEESENTLNAILRELDGIEPSDDIIFICATNRPEVLDQAFTRPGRIDKIIKMGKPGMEGRQAILKVHMQLTQQDATISPLFDSNIDLQRIAQATPEMSGADLKNLIRFALEKAISKEVKTGSWTPVSTQDLLTQAQKLVAKPKKPNSISKPKLMPVNYYSYRKSNNLIH